MNAETRDVEALQRRNRIELWKGQIREGHVDDGISPLIDSLIDSLILDVSAEVEARVRERIAQAIEDRKVPSSERGTPGRLERAVYADAARIARGAR